ncbi:MAG: GNAT family N-acetyltransferase [Rhizobiaceae bacterium]|nr:GNAT family N-acetyltransferase [Rhizobiaceae bacterium]
MSIEIRPVSRDDHSRWRNLWTEYLNFYNTKLPDNVFDSSWERLFAEGEFEPRCFLAMIDGEAVGLVHYLFHRSMWSLEGNCYLQDLFTSQAARGKGVGAALIDAVKTAAAERGVANVYWMTHETNHTAQALYNRVARRTGFIEYDLL